MQYANIESYSFKLTDLIKNSQIMEFKPRIENKKSLVQNTYATLQDNCDKSAGKIIFVNNFTQIDGDNYNTSIGTIITESGKLVFNLSYEIFKDSLPYLDPGRTLKTTPTYKSDNYDNYDNNVLITITSLGDLDQTRVLTIQY